MTNPHANTTLDRAILVGQSGALAFAAGLIGATGAAAAIAFPTMRDLAPDIPGLESVGDHWMIAAGSVMAPVFTVVVSLAAAAIALATLLWVVQTLRGRSASRALVTRGVALLVTLAVAGHSQIVLVPRMNANFNGFLAAARNGDDAEVRRLRDAFDADHPVSSRSLSAIFALSLVSAALTIWAPAPRRRSAATPSQGATP